jgi:hypothetical protein
VSPLLQTQATASGFRRCLATTRQVENVIVIAQRDLLGCPDYALYSTLSWRRGYLAIGLWSGNGIRTCRDLTRLMRFVGEDLL